MNILQDLTARQRRLLYAVGGTVLLIATVGVLLPSTLRVDQEITIDANAATIYALLNDFEQIKKWSPQMNVDPNARYDISGPRRGVGATLRWEGNIIGRGGQTIIDSVPYERVASELDEGDDTVAFSVITLSDSTSGTLASWSYEREFGINIFRRLLGLVQADVIERDYRQGLENLRSMAESLPRADFSDLKVEQFVVEATEIAYLTASSEPLAAAIAETTGDAYFNILSFIDDHGLQEAGAPIIISRGFSGSKLSFDAAIPVRGVNSATPRSARKVKLGNTYSGPVIRVRHLGSYANLAETHGKIAAYLAAFGIERNGDAWESYVSDPTRTAEAELVTYVYYPVRN